MTTDHIDIADNDSSRVLSDATTVLDEWSRGSLPDSHAKPFLKSRTKQLEILSSKDGHIAFQAQVIRERADTALKREDFLTVEAKKRRAKRDNIECALANQPGETAPPECFESYDVMQADSHLHIDQFPRSCDEWVGAHTRFIRDFRQCLEYFSGQDYQLLSLFYTYVLPLENVGLTEEALSVFKNLLPRRDKVYKSCVRYLESLHYQASGRLQEAIETMREAIEAAPDAAYFRMLATMTALSEQELQQVQNAIGQPHVSRQNLSKYHSTLADAHHNAGNIDCAFEHFQSANTLVNTMRVDDIAVMRAWIDRVCAVCTAEFLQDTPSQSLSQTPVFIVGMPRSGTSLLYNILCCHQSQAGESDVHGIGETMYGKASRWLFSHQGNDLYPECLKKNTTAEVCNVAQAFDQKLFERVPENAQPTTKRIICKWPMEFMEIGHVARLFPNAHFIHLYRHPLDTCLSLFKRDFGDSIRFSNDLDTLGTYYAQCYIPLMQHWHTHMPSEKLVGVNYENLVTNPQQELKRITDFLGLDEDPTCCQHERYGKYSFTEHRSVDAISTSAIGQWKRYEKYLGPLKKHLGVEPITF
jgi:tetratricopeptide (TPR) repeat protein